jgi:hypothetical protein
MTTEGAVDTITGCIGAATGWTDITPYPDNGRGSETGCVRGGVGVGTVTTAGGGAGVNILARTGAAGMVVTTIGRGADGS